MLEVKESISDSRIILSIAKYRAACEALGYDYLSILRVKIGNATYTKVLIRCKHDGYIKAVLHRTLCARKVMCRVCQVAKYQLLLSQKDCKYIRHYRGAINGTKVLYSNKYGEEYESDVGNILTSNFSVSKDSSWYQQHSVYAIEAQDERGVYLKIGTANIPDVRYKCLRILCESRVKTLATFQDRFMADRLESYLHRFFHAQRLKREDVSHIIGRVETRKRKRGDNVEIKDGATEWFSGSIAETLYSMDFSTIEV